MLEHNSFGWNAFALTFNGDNAEIKMTVHEDEVQLPIGLDGLVRLKHVQKLDRLADDEPAALKGNWVDDQTFALHLFIVGSPENWRIETMFMDETVRVRILDRMNDQAEQFNGRAAA